ncbi:MAG: GDSL-type esterase/lipase family protein [Oscillospiraceae bacterium]|nr:GDSL-type esterase/lipase family protein [Oscillospiraceae bacterium]
MNTVFVKRIVFTAAILSAAYFSGCHKVEETAVTETLPTPTVMTTSEAVPAMAVITESEIETESETTTGTETEAAPRVIVPKLEWDSLDWNKEFMEDTLFVGDSVCRALYVYNDLLTTKQVAATGGGAARNIYDYTFKMEDNEFTLREAAEYYKPRVFFLWMGINDINMTEKDVYANNLKAIAEDMLSISTDSKVVILSMSPTADYHEWNANERMREYNAAAKEMCEAIEGEEIYYLDIQDILSDEDGYLLPECDSGDGMHLSQMAYTRLLSYITFAMDEAAPAETMQSDTVSEILSDITDTEQSSD